MKIRTALAILVATGTAAAGWSAATPGEIPGVTNPVRARQHWILQCQGCHRADATGTPATTPAMAGIIGKFLSVPGGREYLGQVPGVATAALSDTDLAELVNWTLVRFDAGHVPADFKPYTAAEMATLRAKVLRVETAQVRARLTAQFTPDEGTASQK